MLLLVPFKETGYATVGSKMVRMLACPVMCFNQEVLLVTSNNACLEMKAKRIVYLVLYYQIFYSEIKYISLKITLVVSSIMQ